jgi:hypothetical protein
MAKSCLAFAVSCILLTGTAAAQESVFFGRVAGSNHTSGPPADWTATITVIRKADNKVLQSYVSQGDLFACTAPLKQDVRLIVMAVGYEARMTEISGSADPRRVRPDLILEHIPQKYTAMSKSLTAEEFEQRLKEQAELATLSGQTDIYQVNFAAYKRATASRPDLATKAVQFEKTAEFQRLVTDPGRSRLPEGALHNLTEPGKTVTPIEQKELLDIVQNEGYSRPVRINAIKSLTTTPRLSADVQTPLVESLRKWSADPASELYVAATAGVMKWGSAQDQQAIVNTMTNASASTQALAVSAVEGGVRSAPATRAVAGVAATTRDPALKITSLKALTGSTDPEAIKAARARLAAAEPEAVRLQAVRVLATAPMTDDLRAFLAGVSKSDASAEVRAIAANAARRDK